MAELIPGICTQCGATLSVDKDKDCMICPYCNTPFVVDKAVKNFNTTYNITNNIHAENVYVQGSVNSGFEIVGGVLKKYTGEAVDVVIPENVRKIGEKAFECSMIHTVSLPSNLLSIESCAFRGCTQLEEVVLPDGVQVIGECAFGGCTQLKEIQLPNSVRTIASYSFAGCAQLKKIQLPNGVRTIDQQAFQDCTGLEEITIPDTVKTIGSCAFEGCEMLKEIVIPDTVTELGSQLFGGCIRLKVAVLPRFINSMFYRCRIDDAPCDSLETLQIGSRTEWNPEELKELGLAESTAIYQRAIIRCRKMGVCQYCGGKFAGLFPPRCTVCRRRKDYN